MLDHSDDSNDGVTLRKLNGRLSICAKQMDVQTLGPMIHILEHFFDLRRHQLSNTCLRFNAYTVSGGS